MPRLKTGYFLTGLVIIAVVFLVSFLLFPDWQLNWRLFLVLFVVVAEAVVGFLANFRQAFFEEKKDESVENISLALGKQVSKLNVDKLNASEANIGKSIVGGDVIAASNSIVQTGGTSITLADGQKIEIFAKASMALPPGCAPPVPRLIVGRDDDMRELRRRLVIGREEQKTPPLQVLSAIKGWPGVGKTTIASALANDEEILKAYPDGVLWVSLGQEPNLLSEMAVWGRALGNEELLHARSLEEARNQLAALLRNRRMLLIIDDVWKPEDAAPFNIGGRNCATLITTRLDGVANALAPLVSNIYRLQVLKDEDALELLKQLAPSVMKKYPYESVALVQELEGLPLALQVAGRMLNTEESYGFGVNQLIQDLQDGARLLEAKAPVEFVDLVNETTPTIAALLKKSLDRLDETTRDRYAYLGVFAPKPAMFDIEAMKFVWKVEDPKPTVKILVDRGLLEYFPEMSLYQMHALLVALAKSLLTDD
jgi:hypothetical protein